MVNLHKLQMLVLVMAGGSISSISSDSDTCLWQTGDFCISIKYSILKPSYPRYSLSNCSKRRTFDKSISEVRTSVKMIKVRKGRGRNWSHEDRKQSRDEPVAWFEDNIKKKKNWKKRHKKIIEESIKMAYT